MNKKSPESEIAEKISVLRDLNKELDELDKSFNTLSSANDYNKIMEEISPKERMDLNWEMGYSTYTLYYCN
jgi:hypothetical protein